jgi:hypothetical protein
MEQGWRHGRSTSGVQHLVVFASAPTWSCAHDETMKHQDTSLENGKLTLPSAICTNVSSAMMSVTSALGFAAPLYTLPVFLRSMVQMPSWPEEDLRLNWKMPFVWRGDGS